MGKKLFFVIAFTMLFFVVFPCLGESIWKEGIIGTGEKWETRGYIQDSGEKGLKVLIIGGIHGDEPAGFLGAEELLSKIKIQSGKVILIPRANKKAINAESRFPEGSQDLNRSFGKISPANWTENLARDIIRFIKDFELDLIIDLHESKEFYKEDPKSVGQTIIFNAQGKKIIMLLELIEKTNEQLPLEHSFSLLTPTYQGSLSRFAYDELGINSFIVETTMKLPLEERVYQQKKIVISSLRILGLIKECDL